MFEMPSIFMCWGVPGPKQPCQWACYCRKQAGLPVVTGEEIHDAFVHHAYSELQHEIGKEHVFENEPAFVIWIVRLEANNKCVERDDLVCTTYNFCCNLSTDKYEEEKNTCGSTSAQPPPPQLWTFSAVSTTLEKTDGSFERVCRYPQKNAPMRISNTMIERKQPQHFIVFESSSQMKARNTY